jgi:hypothetical protein
MTILLGLRHHFHREQSIMGAATSAVKTTSAAAPVPRYSIGILALVSSSSLFKSRDAFRPRSEQQCGKGDKCLPGKSHSKLETLRSNDCVVIPKPFHYRCPLFRAELFDEPTLFWTDSDWRLEVSDVSTGREIKVADDASC